MTAEIAILNKSAIALAADSKVTIGSAGREKTYDTVNKLFSLSKTEPMGAMVFGNAEFMGFPWETVIKEYRRENPTKKFDTVFDWAENFLTYVRGFFDFDGNDQVNNISSIVFSELSAIARSALQDAVMESPDNQDVSEIVVSRFSEEMDDWEEVPDYFDDEEWAKFLSLDPDMFVSVITENFKYIKPEHTEIASRFAEQIARKAIPSSSSSGLVLAGFGDNERLPSLIAYELDGVICDRLKIIESRKVDVSRDMEGSIVPFAQQDMVFRFMEGIDPDYQRSLEDSIQRLLFENSLNMARVFGLSDEEITEKRDAVFEAVKDSFDEFNSSSASYRRQVFAAPIIDMAMRLPRDELAHLAESLVSLTSLQRRVSRDVETVGGPIDVAVISKGDGFVWIKRKHYFPADKNLRFVNAYFSEYKPEQNGDDQ